MVMLEQRADIKIRRGKFTDATAIATTFRDSWRQAYTGIIPHLHLETMIRQRGPDWWANAMRSGENLFIIEQAGAVAGYATLGASRTRGPYQGEIYELYIAPEHQGVGLGEHLFEAARFALDRRRLRGLIVWALAENTIATDFYWRRGGRPVKEIVEAIGGKKLDKVAFTWP